MHRGTTGSEISLVESSNVYNLFQTSGGLSSRFRMVCDDVLRQLVVMSPLDSYAVCKTWGEWCKDVVLDLELGEEEKLASAINGKHHLRCLAIKFPQRRLRQDTLLAGLEEVPSLVHLTLKRLDSGLITGLARRFPNLRHCVLQNHYGNGFRADYIQRFLDACALLETLEVEFKFCYRATVLKSSSVKHIAIHNVFNHLELDMPQLQKVKFVNIHCRLRKFVIESSNLQLLQLERLWSHVPLEFPKMHPCQEVVVTLADYCHGITGIHILAWRKVTVKVVMVLLMVKETLFSDILDMLLETYPDLEVTVECELAGVSNKARAQMMKSFCGRFGHPKVKVRQL